MSGLSTVVREAENKKGRVLFVTVSTESNVPSKSGNMILGQPLLSGKLIHSVHFKWVHCL